MTYLQDYHAIMARGQTGLENARGKLQPQGWNLFKASVSAIGIIAACASEAFSMTIALHAQYPVLSDGTDLGSEMLSMRYGVIAALILTHAVLHESPNQPNRFMGRLLGKARFLPILAIVGGISVFMFVATAQATASDDGQMGYAGMGIGAACAALLSISMLAANRLMGVFLNALKTIFGGRAERSKVADIARELKAASACRSELETLRREIAAREAPDALRHKAAQEAASIIGMVAVEAHDIHALREALGEELRPQDVVKGLPDTPLPVLDRLQSTLKRMNVPFFLNLLNTNKEARS